MICLDDPGSDSIVASILRLILDVCMATCIITFNVFILYAVLRYWKRQLLPPSHINSTILITSLCVADVTVGVSFVYQILPRRTLTMVGIAWTTSVLLTTSQFYWNNWTEGEVCETVNFQDKYYEITVLPSIFLFTSISLALIYWKIHSVALTVHNRRMNHDLSRKERLHTKSAKTLLLILIFYVVSWVPYIVCTLLRQAGIYVSITLVGVFSSETKVTYLANPFIYALNTRPVKQSILKSFAGLRMLFGRTNTKNSNSSKSNTSVTTVCQEHSEIEIGNAVGDFKNDKQET